MAKVLLPARTWVNLYVATGITVGNQLRIIKMTSDDPLLATTLAAPDIAGGDDYVNLNHELHVSLNEVGDPGAWGMSVAGGAIDVTEVVAS